MKTLKQKLIATVGKLLPEITAPGLKYSTTLESIINQKNLGSNLYDDKASVTIIVFSKDRAIQLHALLASFYELVNGDAEVKILYTASTKEHRDAYNKLKRIFSKTAVSFKLEESFRADLCDVLNNITTTKTMFLVDDLLFKEPLDLGEFIKYNTSYFVPSLRMGNHLTYSYTTRRKQPLPVFVNSSNTPTNKLVWKWEDGELDWGYPLSVDGHLFDTLEIKTIINNLEFKAPNSLEESMQRYNPIFKTRYGLAFKQSVIINVPNNKVQQENNNHAGSLSTNFLLQKWQEGYQIDYKKLRHIRNISAHQEIDIEFIKFETEYSL